MSAPQPSSSSPEAQPTRRSFELIRKIDAAWYRGELWLCGAMFLSMSLIVFVSVVRDVFGTRHSWLDAFVFFLLAFAAASTRVRKGNEKKRPVWLNAVIALVVTAAVGGLVELYVTVLPGGFPWAPKMALCLMLWVAFLGASMATHEKVHIALEVGEKIWPKRLQRIVKTLAHVVTTAFCFMLFILSIESIAGHFELWEASGGSGNTIPTLDWLPQWAVFLIFPYVFLAMAIRFAAQTVTTATGTAAPPFGSEAGPVAEAAEEAAR